MDNHQQHPTTTDAYLTAEQDSESDVRKARWFFIGLLGNILGVLIASVYEPTPSASRLLGKLPEYAALYTDSYKARGRAIQVRQSVIGLITALGFSILMAILL